MHRKVKGLLSLILAFAMVTAATAPVFADELSEEVQQPAEEQPVTEDEIKVEIEAESEEQNVSEPVEEQAVIDTEAIPVEQNTAEMKFVGEQAIEEQPITETGTEPVEQNVVEIAAVSDSETDPETLYNTLTEEQRQFDVYTGIYSIDKLLSGTNVFAELSFTEKGVVPGSDNLAAQGGTLVGTILAGRQGDLNFYRLHEWKVWKVNSSGAPGSVVVSGSSLDKLATKDNFIKSAYMVKTESGILFSRPILEPVWEPLDYAIPVYDADGNDTGTTITVNAENYNEISFPGTETGSWKLIYAETEYQLDTASEIWTNETNGIRTIGKNFNEAQAKIQAVVTQTVLQEGTAEFAQPDWYEGQPMAAPVVSSATNGIENIIYYYKEAGADDSAYTTVVPEKAGSYTAKAVFAATEFYQEVTRTADFQILPVQVTLQEGTAEFVQLDWYEGQPMAAPVVSSATNGIENIIYYYKEAGADDSAYTTIVPEKAGSYTAMAVFAATEVYQEVIKTADFQILPIQVVLQEGTAEFSQPGWYEGKLKPEPVVSSATNGVENITYYYKEAGADDSAYTAVVPEKAGLYTAMAVFAATEVYQEVIKTADFEILPNPPADIVDETAPVISGVANGETYYGDQAVSVTDENLYTITVNGEAVEVSNNRADITLTPAEDVYKIIAVDEAGNKTEYTVEVLETWVRDGITTNGKKKLRHERIYKLGSGQWTIDGDSTIYSGGGSFYVKSGGEYNFNRK